MERFLKGLGSAMRATLVFVVNTLSALVVLALGVVLLLVALVAVTDRSDRVTTVETVSSQTERPAATATPPADAAGATATDSETTVTTTADVNTSDAVIVASLVAGLALVLLGLLWGRVTSVEVGPSGLKLAIEAIRRKRDEAAKEATTPPEQANAAAVSAVDRLLLMVGQPLPTAPAADTRASDSWWRRQVLGGFDFAPRTPSLESKDLEGVATVLDADAAAAMAELLFDEELSRLQTQAQQPVSGSDDDQKDG